MKSFNGPPSVARSIRAILENELNITPESDVTDLLEEGLLDSLSFVELLYQLEVVFGVLVQPEDMEFDNFRSVECITAFVCTRIGGASG